MTKHSNMTKQQILIKLTLLVSAYVDQLDEADFFSLPDQFTNSADLLTDFAQHLEYVRSGK